MQSRGVGIIECLVAAVVVGIGFVAVYGLSTASTNVLMSSIEREKANMLSNMIFEDILTDTANIKDCPTTCPYNDMDFKSVHLEQLILMIYINQIGVQMQTHFWEVRQ